MASAQLQKGLASAKGSLGVLASRASSRAGLFSQVAPGLAAQREALVGAGQSLGDRIQKKLFPGLFKPNKAERETLRLTEEALQAQQDVSARSLQGALELEGLGDAAAFPDVRDAIQAAATGDQAGITAFNALMNQGKTAQAQREAAATQLQIQKNQEIRAQELHEKYGGLSVETWGKNIRSIGGLRDGKSTIMDLQTLNREFGKEVLPGRAKGAYLGMRGKLVNTVRLLIEAGALQEGELKFIENLLPDFGAFSTLSADQREVQLNELDRWLDNTNLGFMLTTPGADKVVQGMPQIQGRPIEEILGFAPIDEDDGFVKGPPAPTQTQAPAPPGPAGPIGEGGGVGRAIAKGEQVLGDALRGIFGSELTEEQKAARQ